MSLKVNKKRILAEKGAYVLLYDRTSKGVAPADGHGLIPEIETIREIAKGLINFTNYYSQKDIDRHNDVNLRTETIGKTPFNKRRKKSGYIFIYRELGTNFYRIGQTKELQNRMDSLNNALPVSVELIRYNWFEDIVMLKKYLEELYQEKRSPNDWYRLDNTDIDFFISKKYKDGFYKWLENKAGKKRQITCADCGKVLTELENDYYYSCLLCGSNCCSQKCAYSHNCSPAW